MTVPLNRRELLSAGLGALAASMLQAAASPGAWAKLAGDGRRPFVDRICDLVIPATDTPGASQVQAADFVLLACDHGMAGLTAQSPARLEAALEALANPQHGAPGGTGFLRAPAAAQQAMLARYDADSFARPHPAGSTAAEWPTFKSAIVAAYYTSQAGASQELVYDAVPGSHDDFEPGPGFRMFSNQGFGGSL